MGGPFIGREILNRAGCREGRGRSCGEMGRRVLGEPPQTVIEQHVTHRASSRLYIQIFRFL